MVARPQISSRTDPLLPYPTLFRCLAEPLCRMATGLALLVAPGGHLVLSGLLAREERLIVARYRATGLALRRRIARERSEEHTSELQSLMRISYAVFRLKKKKKAHQKTNTSQKHIKHTT